VRRVLRALSGLAAAVGVLALAGCDPPSAYGPLPADWTAQPDTSQIAATATINGGTVYSGSWSGNEYALDEATGAVRWARDLGQTTGSCGGRLYTQGVTSQAWIRDGRAYLGGGDANWYSLDAGTGSVLWSIPTGDNSITGGHYNWISPLIYANHAYVGIASFCDNPLVQGQLLRVNLSTHRIENVFDVVPDGHVGGTVWMTPVVDPKTNTVFVTTGNQDVGSDPYAESIIALDATTLTVKGHWAIPPSQSTPDGDWTSSAVLFTDAAGNARVAAANKNGNLYVFRRDNLAAGPVWQTRLAQGGPCPNCGDGTASTGIFDGHRLIWAAGKTTIAGKAYNGSVRGIDATTGAVRWELPLSNWPYGRLDQANGMTAVSTSDGNLYVVGNGGGRVLYANNLLSTGLASARVFAAPAITDGRLVIGSNDGVVHAFAFPSAPGSVSAQASAATPCTLRSGTRARADCRLTVSPRCEVVGQLPAEAGAVAVRELVLRARAGRPTRVRLYTNRTCAGRPAVRLRPGAVRLRKRWALPPRAVLAVRASRRATVRLQALGRAEL
jgi:outer membrane protein assembly factor BamB